LPRYGLAKLEDNSIVICGGLLVDSAASSLRSGKHKLQCVNIMYKFDCNTLKWTKLAKLNFRRTLFSMMSVKENGQIFAIGGTINGMK